MGFLVCSCLLILMMRMTSATDTIRIGGIFCDSDRQQESVFQYAIQDINNFDPNWRSRDLMLEPEIVIVEDEDIYNIANETCELASKGIWAIFGPQPSEMAGQVQSICDTLEIPHLETRWNPYQLGHDIDVNLYPQYDILAMVYVDLVKSWKWKSFTIFFEDSEGLIRLSKLMQMYGPKDYTVSVRYLNDPNDYRPVLRNARNSGENNFVLDCSVETLPEILKQAQQVGLIVKSNNFIITSLDTHTVDLEPYKYSECNITSVRLVSHDNVRVQRIVSNWKSYETNSSDTIELNYLKAESALMYDAIQTFARTVEEVGLMRGLAKPLNCSANKYRSHGLTFISYMKNLKSMSYLTGLTGRIRFDSRGFRTMFDLEVVELSRQGLKKVGTWDPEKGLELSRIDEPPEVKQEDTLQNKTLRVLTALTMPYGMLKNTSETLKGNDRFEGYAIDLIQEIAGLLGFNYIFMIQADNKYGSRDPHTKEWNGMIRQLLDHKADLAITDLTITSEREEAADFTMPFMSLGISILYKRPTRAAPNLFSFMDPFSIDVWIVMFIAYIGVSVALFIMGRLSPYEWTNPYPCIEEPEFLENQFSLKNSLWFTIGSLMQQGTEIAPIAVSTRMTAGIWWFFTLIMVSSYTANLAAFLTVESMFSPFKSVYELADQTVIKYGAKDGGSTLGFFRDSNDTMFKRMYDNMIATPNALTKDNDQGLHKVKTENYAFFMESTSIEYIVERHCEVTQINGLLDSKGYGIAMRKNESYRNSINNAVLRLQEKGRLRELKDKWWKQERGGGMCQATESASDNEGLKLENVGGVFVVLIGGVITSIFLTIIELLWKVGRTAYREKISFWNELLEELKFIAKMHGSTKPVRKYNSSKHDSNEELNNFMPLNNYPTKYSFDLGTENH